MSFVIHRLDTTASTNDDAKAAAEKGAAAGTVFWALEQQTGRGRRGRVWASPPGNLYSSVLLRPQTPAASYGLYSFIAALAIGDMVRECLPNAAVELKWPNDVLVGGKKISGILIEAAPDYLVIGMGVNIRHVPENPLYPVTSLLGEGIAPPPLEQLLDRLLHFLGTWDDVLTREGFAPIRAAWLACARKGPMRVRLPQEEIEGTFGDLDPDGHLCLLLPDGSTRKIATGDVFF